MTRVPPQAKRKATTPTCLLSDISGPTKKGLHPSTSRARHADSTGLPGDLLKLRNAGFDETKDHKSLMMIAGTGDFRWRVFPVYESGSSKIPSKYGGSTKY